MKILLVAYDSHPCAGGVDTYLQTLINSFQKKGHKIDLISYSDVQRLSEDAIIRIEKYVDAMNREFVGKAPQSLIATEIKSFIFKQILCSIEVNSYDIIHSQIGILNPIIRELYPNIPLVGTIHGCIYSESLNWLSNKSEAEFFRDYDRSSVQIPDKVITVSSYVDKNLPPIPKEKHEVIYNGVDTSIFKPSSKSNNVIKLVTLGNFYHIKGYDLLLKALFNLKKEDLSFELTMFGDGPELVNYEKFVTIHKLPVKFGGRISRQELINQLPEFDVLVQPSRLENFPFSVIEAMAAGCAVVCSNVNGMNEQVSHFQNGLLFDSENIEKLSECLRYLISNRKETEKMGIQARIEAKERFSVETMADKHEEIYKRLLGISENHMDHIQENKNNENINTLVDQEHWNHIYEGLNLYRPSDNDSFRLWINDHIPNGVGKSCIEIGCFPGRFLSIFGDAGYTLNGIDLTPNVEAVPSWLESLGYSVGEFNKVDFLDIDHQNSLYDVVSSFGFIEHFSNWHEILIKHALMVKENGYIVLEVPNFASPLLRCIRMFLDYENYKLHDTSSMYPETWGEILSILDFEICFSGHFGGFNLWLDKMPDNPMKRNLVNLLIDSIPFFNSVEIKESNKNSFCGLIARKKNGLPVSELLKTEVIKKINKIVEDIQEKDRIENDKFQSLYPLFDAWCKYASGER